MAMNKWQSRAEILKGHLDRLPYDQLRSAHPSYYWLHVGQPAWIRARTQKANFNPDQPRVPAGNADGGQWTDADGGYTRSVSVELLGDLSAGLQLSASQLSIDYSAALTGISTIDETTKSLSETLARTMQLTDFIPEQTPQAYGTAVHMAFGTVVRMQGLRGIGPDDVEQSFGGSYGELGSIRTDILLRNDVGDIIAIYDLKTGGTYLKPGRVRELREKTGVGPDVPVIELHVVRGARLKAWMRKIGR
jgi:hypothetical protein